MNESKWYSIDDKEKIINKAIENGFCRDWFYRAQVQKVDLITDNHYVILNIYDGELESDLFYAEPLSKFDKVFEEYDKERLLINEGESA